jgi:hypothetical protein
MPLMDHTDATNCVIGGRLHIPAIVDLFGEGSFDHPFEAPWSNLLNMSGPTGNLAN